MTTSKHPKIAAAILDGIRGGRYQERLPGINQLAAEFGVNNRTMIKAIASLEEEGAVRRIPSRGTFVTRLRRKRSNIVGTCFPGQVIGQLHADLFAGLSARAKKHGHTVAEGMPHGGDSARQLETVRQLVDLHRVDGVVIWPTTGDCQATLDFLHEQDVPFVMVPDSELPERFPDCDTISVEDAGAHELADHLIAHGYQRIRMATPDLTAGSYMKHRYDSLCAELRASGLPVLPPLIVPEPIGHGYRDLPAEIVAELRELDAVFAVTDRLAGLIFRSCARHGIRVPADLALAGYDNSAIADLLGLTSVAQNFQRVGAEAFDLILDELDNPWSDRQHRWVHAHLVIRESTVG